MRAPLALCSILVASGCGPRALSREEYLTQANSIAKDFEAYQSEVNSNPLPKVAGLSKADARKVLADSLRVNADHDDEFCRRMAALVPPPELADHKAAFLNLLGGLGPKVRIWADAIQSGDRGKASAAGADIDSFLLRSMAALIAMLEKHGEDASSLKRQRAELGAELGQKG